MERFILFDDKNTWYDWKLILTAKDIKPPEPKTNYVNLDGRSGSLDLTEALTGEVTYSDRTLTLSFWTCEGSHKDRENVIRNIVAHLHGKKVKIIEPDDTDHYFYGRAKITSRVNTMAYAEISIECTCEPWKYSCHETIRTVPVNSQEVTSVIVNNGGMKTLSPVFAITGDVTITYNGSTYTLTDGLYTIPDVKLYQGVNAVGVSGDGVVKLSYREADL